MKKRTLHIHKKRNNNTYDLIKYKDTSFEDIHIRSFVSRALADYGWTIDLFPCVLKLAGIDTPIRLYSLNGNIFYGHTELSQQTFKFEFTKENFSISSNGITNTYSLNRRYSNDLSLQIIPKKRIIEKKDRTLICLYGDRAYHYSLKINNFTLDIEKAFCLELPTISNEIENLLLSIDFHKFIYDTTDVYLKLKKLFQKASAKMPNMKLTIQASRDLSVGKSFITSLISIDKNGKLTEFAITQPDGSETYHVFSSGNWKWTYFQGISELSYCRQNDRFDYSVHGSLHTIETFENPADTIKKVYPEMEKLLKNLGKKF